MSSMSESQEYYREYLLRSLGRLTQYVKQNSPGVMIGDELARAVWHATGLCGPHLWTAIAERITADVRRSGGFCQHCDTRMPDEETTYPVCEPCEKKQLREDDET